MTIRPESADCESKKNACTTCVWFCQRATLASKNSSCDILKGIYTIMLAWQSWP